MSEYPVRSEAANPKRIDFRFKSDKTMAVAAASAAWMTTTVKPHLHPKCRAPLNSLPFVHACIRTLGYTKAGDFLREARELQDVTSASEGGYGKADIVKEVA